MAMKENQFQGLTALSKTALEWALTDAQHRASFRTGSSEVSFVVKSIDLLVDIFLAHLDDSAPLQIFQHFRLPPKQFYKLLRSEGSFEPENASSHRERLSQMPSRPAGRLHPDGYQPRRAA